MLTQPFQSRHTHPRQAPTAYFFVRNTTVYYLINSTTANDLWSYANSRADAVQYVLDLSPTTFISTYSNVSSIPDNLATYPSALMQKTTPNTASTSKVEIKYDLGLFNGMLFKDFVEGGAHMEFVRYVLQTSVANRFTYTSYLQFAVESPSVGSFSTYVWEPYLNTDTQGAMLYQQWVTNRINASTGTNGSWPWAPTTAYGTC
jgi:hypothetical protein